MSPSAVVGTDVSVDRAMSSAPDSHETRADNALSDSCDHHSNSWLPKAEPGAIESYSGK